MNSTKPSTASPTARNKGFILLAAATVLILAAVSLFVGKYPLSLRELFAGNERQLQVFYTLRLSRTAVAVLGGFILGVCGFVYQTIFQNPLASPDIIGVSSGASAGAAAGILFFGSAFAVTAFAFTGSLLAVALVLGLSAIDKGSKKATIVLAGIAVHALAQTVLMTLKILADPERELASIEYWIMGSLSDISSFRIGGNLFLGMLCVLILFFLHRQTLLLSAEEGEAKMLGASVGRLRFTVLIIATLSVSAVVSLTGLISFIGLLAPHGARLFTKNNKLGTLFLSGLFGSILLCGADILARSVSQTELPVSVFTSLLGAPALIILLMKGRKMA